MSYFDTDGDGHINYDEFLVGIRVSQIFQFRIFFEDFMAEELFFKF